MSRRKLLHGKKSQPAWLSRCKMPISEDCLSLRITSSWAIQCFKPSFHQMLDKYGNDPVSIAEAIAWNHMPFCHVIPITEAEIELRRRMVEAIETLIQRPEATRGKSPLWLAALLDG